jgi:ABC1 atypical kinase-like domain
MDQARRSPCITVRPPFGELLLGTSSYAEVKTIIRSEFGRDSGDVYAPVDPEPVAAASIGQVHRATLPSGEAWP